MEVKVGIVVSPLAQIEEGVVGRMFAELVVGRIDAVFEGPRSDAFGGDEERGEISLGFFVIYSK